MQKLLKNFYFFTKLSSSILLLLIIVFFIYLFSRSYMKQNNESSLNRIDEFSEMKNEITLQLEDNYKSINNAIEKINEIEKEINKLKSSNNIINDQSFKESLDQISEDLLALQKNKKEIKEEPNIDFMENEKRFIINKYLESVKISIEKGNKFNDYMAELENLLDIEQFPNLEKLKILSFEEILSFNDLKKDFDDKSNYFLKDHLIKESNNSIIIEFLLSFFILRSDYNIHSQDVVVQNISFAKNFLNERNISLAIIELSKIDKIEEYYSSWIADAEKFDESLRLLKIIKENFEG